MAVKDTILHEFRQSRINGARIPLGAVNSEPTAVPGLPIKTRALAHV